jgi:TolB-like protein/DNA-binding SARP family transcriptional activator
MLRLLTFGGCRIERDGARLDGLSGQRKALGLLAMLAAAGDRGVSRDSLVAHLWPDSNEDRARTSLKQLAHSVRHHTQAPTLLSSSAELRLNPDLITSDVAEFTNAVSRGDHATIVALYAGPFLDGFYVRGAGEFERWAAAERLWLGQEYAQALEKLAGQASAQGDVIAAVSWWRRLAALDPLSGRFAIGLMRALDAAGDRSAALRHARTYRQMVAAEIDDAAPDPAVDEAAAQIRRAPPRAVPSPPSMPMAERSRHRDPVAAAGEAMPSVAVLPFANTSSDPADEPFADGLTDELIGAISRLPGVTLTGRTSAFALKGRDLGVRAIADMLGVTNLLEGSIRRNGGRIKVAAQLVNAADNRVLWAESYDRTTDDIFPVQEEIARATAQALRVKLGVAGGLLARQAADLGAYELYLKGRYLLNTRSSRERLLQAVRYFEQAAECDPDYAPAFAGLSDAYAYLAVFAYQRAHEAFPLAMAAARKALALDDTLTEAHAALAHALCVYDFEWAAAEREFRRAIALDPGYTFARLSFSICLQDQARFDEAVEQLEAARAADPLAPHVSAVLGRVHVNARRPDLAIRVLHEAMELAPDLDLVHQQLGHAYLQKHMHSEAIAAFVRAVELSGVRDSAHLAYAYAVTGSRTDAERILESLLDPSASHGLLPFHIALIYAGLGDADAAFEWLQRAYIERASFMDGVGVTPAFDVLHGDARWTRILERMGLQP